jgi:hypothetical protein
MPFYLPICKCYRWHKFKVTINESSLKFGLVLMKVPGFEGVCCRRMVGWTPSPHTWDLVQLSLQMILESLPLLWWQLWWLLWYCSLVLGMHWISIVLWWWHVGIWRRVGMDISVYISASESLGGGLLRLATALKKEKNQVMMCGFQSDHYKVLSPGMWCCLATLLFPSMFVWFSRDPDNRYST